VSDNINQDVAISGAGNIVVGKGDVIINPLPPAEARLRHDLGILLKNVETTWIKGVLEKSVHDAVLLQLGIELRADAVDNPWNMILEDTNQTREELPRGRNIKDIFNEANRLLLILGEPGSGKTTTLLQLARDLIAEVDSAFTQPVPVILNLSTWTNKQQPLDEWIVIELSNKYRLPKKDGKRWLEERRILPLLDGLDEVREENRGTCVEKINQLIKDYGLQGLVVCSRVKDYTDLNARLAFYRAIYLQSLTTKQVDEYLNRAGDKLAGLHSALQANEALQSLAQSPLILNIMSLAYQNTSAEALRDSELVTNKARRKQLFDTYIARMFNRRIGANVYDKEQTKQRLSWLAWNMQKHNQEVFFIEGLQPSWLPMWSWKLGYIFVSRLVSISILGLALQLSGDIWQSIAISLIVGLLISCIDVIWFKRFSKRIVKQRSFIFWRSIINVAIIFLTVGLVLVFIRLLSQWSLYSDAVLYIGLIPGLVFGVRSSKQIWEDDIQTVEALRWSWRNSLSSILIIGLIAIIGRLKYGALITHNQKGFMWINGNLIEWLSLTPILVVFSGLRRKIIETKSTPNEGIILSEKNAAFGGLVIGLISTGLSYGLVSGLNFNNFHWNSLLLDLQFGFQFYGTRFGMIGILWYGGLDVIQHYTLRLILIIQGHTPRNYARFLDYTVDHIFLQKVGGGYRFIHRMLLEHFAEMYERKS